MNTIQTLLHGIVDYAGLFPPAQLEMEPAVQNFAAYRAGDTAWALGRFILPVGQLRHFEEAVSSCVPFGTTANPWRLSVLSSSDLSADAASIMEFNERNASRADDGAVLIDTIEIKVQNKEQIEAAATQLPELVQPYFELPITSAPDELIRAAGRVGGRAKVRTGGTSVDAFPASADLLRFLAGCVEAGVPFKATAGLHHPLRSVHPLTYVANAPTGMMFGFLNVFVSAALLFAGVPAKDAAAALEEADRQAFHFDQDLLRWRSYTLDVSTLAQARHVAISFGSCSFSEPIEDLKAMNLL